MVHSTSIGLDVHARSIAASALVHETGEVVRASFAGGDAAGVAAWAAGLPRLPFAEIASLGTAFSSLPEKIRTVTITPPTPSNLFRVTDKFGNPLDATVLQSFNDGSGYTASFRDQSNKHINGLGRLHPAGPQAVSATTTIPYDPTSLFMATALMQLNKKVDDIRETQLEMLEYPKDRDRAVVRGNLETLSGILEDYRFNWNNETYKRNKHNLVQTIRNEADKAIVFHRAQVKRSLADSGPIHVDEDVRKKARATKAELEEYRLSVYLYGYSLFLEVMLLGNFGSGYLKAAADKIEQKSLEYRKAYTDAYNLIDADADSSVRATLLGGISQVAGTLGKAIEKTPVGDLTPIDEGLQDASKNVELFNEGVKGDMLGGLIEESSVDVRPFVAGIESVSHLYNDPMMLLADGENVYILPGSDVHASDQ